MKINQINKLATTVLATSILLSGCGSDSNTASTAGTTTDSTTGNNTSATSNETTSSDGSNIYVIDTASVSACDTKSGAALVSCYAETFVNSLTDTQKTTAVVSYSEDTAKQWSNLPVGAAARPGIALGDLTDIQVGYAKGLIKVISGTSDNEGWSEIVQTLNADDYLHDQRNGYGAGLYYLTILGTPSNTDKWGILFTGHHLAVSNTYNNGALAGGTPQFRAIEPMSTFTQNGQSNQPLQQEAAAFAAMLQSLSSSELSSARLSGTWNDIITGPGNDDSIPSTSSGIKVANLTDSQKALVMTAIKTYINDLADNDASAYLSTYTNELDDTYIAYSGTTGVATVGDYVRIDGPSVWIEYSVQNGVIESDPHPHSIWRDKGTDYGSN